MKFVLCELVMLGVVVMKCVIDWVWWYIYKLLDISILVRCASEIMPCALVDEKWLWWARVEMRIEWIVMNCGNMDNGERPTVLFIFAYQIWMKLMKWKWVQPQMGGDFLLVWALAPIHCIYVSCSDIDSIYI